MHWISKLGIVALCMAVGLGLGYVLYRFRVFRMVPVRPKSDRDAKHKVEKQELINKQIQLKNDEDLDDDEPLPELNLSGSEEADVEKQVDKQLKKLLQPGTRFLRVASRSKPTTILSRNTTPIATRLLD